MLGVGKPRVVVVSNLLPFDAVPHAGGRYLSALTRALEGRADMAVVVANTPAARYAVLQPGAPRRSLIAGLGRASWVGRAGGYAATHLDRWLRPRDPGLPSLDLAWELVRDPRLRRLVAGADVLDLQWSEAIRLAPLLRRLNPRARMIGTFHDVQSQLFEREIVVDPGRASYWQAMAARSRRAERRALDRLDVVLAFGDKDLHLLGDPAHGRVIRPPLATSAQARHTTPPGPPTVLFVSHLARPENVDGVRWLLRATWPAVLDRVPDARLHLAGAGAPTELTELVASVDSVHLLGFVDDLDPVYAAAHVVVVPLRTGAGLKFKTVEALVRGIPVVTTSVGAEGVGPPELFAALADHPAGVADGLVGVLTDPAAYAAPAAAAREWAQSEYGAERFTATVVDALGL